MDTIAPVYGWLHIQVDILDNPDQDLGFGLAVLFFLPLTCFYYLYYLYYLLFVQLKPFQAFFFFPFLALSGMYYYGINT